MSVCWTSDNENSQFARFVGLGFIAHLTVESLADGSWDWHVWDQIGWLEPSYGLSETIESAKAQAELALAAYLNSKIEA